MVEQKHFDALEEAAIILSNRSLSNSPGALSTMLKELPALIRAMQARIVELESAPQRLQAGRLAAIAALGEHHVCDQGCGEGHCMSNEQRHQIRLSEYAKEFATTPPQPAAPVVEGLSDEE